MLGPDKMRRDYAEMRVTVNAPTKLVVILDTGVYSSFIRKVEISGGLKQNVRPTPIPTNILDVHGTKSL